MKYIEYEDLEKGAKYYCQLYDGERLFLEYFGDGMFEDDDFTYTIYGDVRYILNKQEGNNNEG